MPTVTKNHRVRSILFRFHRALFAFSIGLSLFLTMQGMEVGFWTPSASAACEGGLPGIMDIANPFFEQLPGTFDRDAYLKCEIQNIYNIGFYVAVGLATIMVIIGGIRYTTAGGNSSEAGEAKTMIKEALIGLGIALLAAAFTAFLQS